MMAGYVVGLGSGEPAMNAFYEYHRDSIRFGYIGVLTGFC
jgi:hypothetical protein